MANDDKFDQLAEDLGESTVIAFTQRPDVLQPEYDLTGTDDFDVAIALAVRGLVVMILDSIGFYDDEDDEDPEDSR